MMTLPKSCLTPFVWYFRMRSTTFTEHRRKISQIWNLECKSLRLNLLIVPIKIATKSIRSFHWGLGRFPPGNSNTKIQLILNVLCSLIVALLQRTHLLFYLFFLLVPFEVFVRIEVHRMYVWFREEEKRNKHEIEKDREHTEQ